MTRKRKGQPLSMAREFASSLVRGKNRLGGNKRPAQLIGQQVFSYDLRWVRPIIPDLRRKSRKRKIKKLKERGRAARDGPHRTVLAGREKSSGCYQREDHELSLCPGNRKIHAGKLRVSCG